MSIWLSVISLYLFIAGMLGIFFAAYAFSNGRTLMIQSFGLSTFSVSIYLFGYMAELNSTTLSQMIFWNQVQYFGLPFFGGLWVLSALIYGKKIRKVHGSYFFLLFMIPIVTFFLRLSNGHHHLYYTDFTLGYSQLGFPTLLLGKGIWYYIQSGHLMVSVVVAAFYYISMYRRKKIKENHVLILVSSIIPLVGLFLILFDVGKTGLDYSALVIPISLFLLLYSIFQYDFLDIRSLAHETIFRASDDAMMISDFEGEITEWNQVFATLFPQMKEEKRENIFLSDFLKGVDLEETFFWKEHDYEKDSRIYQVNNRVLFSSRKTPIGTLHIFHDITQQKKVEKELYQMANYDGLTKLLNRRAFMEQILEPKEDKNCFLLMIDLDYFKKINDTWGHACGDQVLIAFSKLLGDFFGEESSIGRLGGEEFGVLFYVKTEEEAILLSKQLCCTVEQKPVIFEGISVFYTMSGGLCILDGELTKVMRGGDKALYLAKENGRNRIEVQNQGQN